MMVDQTADASPDVAIIGGGIAGSSLAIVLHRMGLDVHLVERSAAFRDRIRGETIHPWGVAELRALGLYEIATERAEAQEQLLWQRYTDRLPEEPYRWADDFPNAPNGLGFAHVALQNAMLAIALEAGVTVHRPAEVIFDRSGGRPVLTISTSTGETIVLPRLVVGADGEHSATRRWLGGDVTTDPPHHHIGGAMIRGLGLATDRIHQAYFKGGFIFASAQAHDVARVYLVCGSDDAMTIQQSPDPAADFVERFRTSVPEGMIGESWESIGPVGFFRNNPTMVDIPASSDVVLIGDASGRNDPSQGHGLSIVFHDVRILSDLLAADPDWRDVPNVFHARKRAYMETLRQHAHWLERQATETGPEIDAMKDRIAHARELDPTAGGFAAIFAIGPDSLVADDAARRHFLGEDLDCADNPVKVDIRQ